MLLIFMNVGFLMYMGNLQYAMSRFSTKNIKANYISEDMINRVLYDGGKFNNYFNEIILMESRGYGHSTNKSKLEKDIIEQENFDLCKLEIDKNTKRMNLNLESEVNDIKSLSKVYIDLVNPIFTPDTPIVDVKNLELEKKLDFEKYLDSLEGIFDHDPRLNSELSGIHIRRQNIYNRAEISLNPSGTRKILFDLEDNIPRKITDFRNEVLLLNIKNRDKNKREKPELILGEKTRLEEIKIKGCFYLEGDLIINQNLDFQGIMIINKGSIFIEEGVRPKIRGMIIYRGEEDLDMTSIEPIYDQQAVYTYGSYLPGYIEPKIALIKKSNIEEK